ncbi:MAG: PEGA domain-containing protein [Myxococcales bacterium]
MLQTRSFLLVMFLSSLELVSRVQAQTGDAAAPSNVVTGVPAAPVVNPPAFEEPPGYAELIDAAIREHELTHFQEARELLLKAHAMFPNARTLRGLGKVEYELRNYGHAVSHLENALASPVRPLDARLRAEVEELLARARAYVGEVHVAVKPSSASVIVDGVTVASGPQAVFSLVVGDHLIEFQAAGHFPERRAVRVKGGEQTNIQVVLNAPLADKEPASPEKAAPSQPSSAPHDDEARTRTRRRWLAWTLSAVAVTGAALAIGFAFRDDSTGRADGGTSGVVLRNP